MILCSDRYVGLVCLLVTVFFIVIITSYTLVLEVLFDTWKFQLVITTKVKRRSQFEWLNDWCVIAFFSNSSAKLELFSRFVNMPFTNKSTYYRYQANYFVSVVEKVWEDVRAANIAKSKKEPVVVLGKLALEYFLISKIYF